MLLRAYQLGISPYLGCNCRFYPSCSDYARQAVSQHATGTGIILAAKRLCKCHPWHPGGVDLVPVVPVAPVHTKNSAVAANDCSSP